MGAQFPNYPENIGGDEPTFAPTKSDRSILAAERGTQRTKRLETDGDGNLYVNVAEGDISVTVGEVEVKNDVGNPIPVSDAGSSLTVDGTVNVGNFPVVQSVDIANSVELEIKNDTGNPIPISDAGSSITVDGTIGVNNFPATQNVAVTSSVELEIKNDSGNPVPISDAGASITVDGTVNIGNFPATQNVAITSPVEFEISNDSGNPVPVSGTVSVAEPVSVDDNGGSLTVDAIDLDIRNLSHSQDSVKVGDGTDFLAVETLGNVFSGTDSKLFTINNKTYAVAIELNAASAGTDNPAILIRNPLGSGKILYFYTISAGVQINNVFITYKLFANPTVTANGTARTPESLNVGGGAAAAITLVNTLPTISANGTALVAKLMSQNGGQLEMTQNGIVALNPNNSLLITANPQSNNRVSAYTLHWAEI